MEVAAETPACRLLHILTLTSGRLTATSHAQEGEGEGKMLGAQDRVLAHPPCTHGVDGPVSALDGPEAGRWR
eukprot:257255-Chlamydomonas_euryale.AAC.1